VGFHVKIKLILGCKSFVALYVIYKLFHAELADLRVIDAVACWLPLEVIQFVLVHFFPYK